MKYDERACKFNMDTGCVELLLRDGRMISINCTGVEDHLDRVSLGAISTKDLNYAIYSNSDHMTINALTQTDLCSLGINFMHQPYKHYDIKNLKINGCEPFLLIGIVRPEGDELSEAAQWFIENFKKLL